VKGPRVSKYSQKIASAPISEHTQVGNWRLWLQYKRTNNSSEFYSFLRIGKFNKTVNATILYCISLEVLHPTNKKLNCIKTKGKKMI
jgi:hypothetical protein